MGYVKKDFLKGLAMALAIEGAKIVAPDVPEPIAYSYNGVILPKLPEWDRERYPYAALFKLYETRYYFIASGNPLWVVNDGTYERLEYDIPCIYCSLNGGTNEWNDMRTAEESNGMTMTVNEPFAWSNHVIEKNGTVWCEPSEPIPVYE